MMSIQDPPYLSVFPVFLEHTMRILNSFGKQYLRVQVLHINPSEARVRLEGSYEICLALNDGSSTYKA
jgi:hypothetical protein